MDLAIPAEVPDLVRVINAAYLVEKFFVSGDRTNAATVERLMKTGVFIVERDGSGAIAGCVYVEGRVTRGYFGMLAVDPPRQGTGLGRRLIEAAERHARERGAHAMDIRVVNLRTELPPFYERLGYLETGTEGADDPRALQPFHFIVMSKIL